MRKFLVLLTIFACTLSVWAEIPQKRQYIPVNRMKNPPGGTFRKKKDGTIVQYNEKGKKIGEYQLQNSGYKKVK